MRTRTKFFSVKQWNTFCMIWILSPTQWQSIWTVENFMKDYDSEKELGILPLVVLWRLPGSSVKHPEHKLGGMKTLPAPLHLPQSLPLNCHKPERELPNPAARKECLKNQKEFPANASRWSSLVESMPLCFILRFHKLKLRALTTTSLAEDSLLLSIKSYFL